MLRKAFILAGNAIFTVTSPELAGGHQTYRVRRVEFEDKPTDNPRLNRAMRERPIVYYFADLLTGPDNTRDYTYLGRVDKSSGALISTSKSPMLDGTNVWSILAAVLKAVWTSEWRYEELYGIDVQHAGKCGRCGRVLTDPQSIEFGIGPVCREALAPS